MKEAEKEVKKSVEIWDKLGEALDNLHARGVIKMLRAKNEWTAKRVEDKLAELDSRYFQVIWGLEEKYNKPIKKLLEEENQETIEKLESLIKLFERTKF